jgi:GNAT superfamily N-acetyltransferase
MADVQLRRMVASDLPAAHALTQAVHWSHRIEDWQFHCALGRGWVAVDAAGTVLGTIVWWAWGKQVATLGLVLVSQQAQGQGIGSLLMKAVMEETDHRALKLMSTDAGLRLYRQCGFTPLGTIEQRQAVPGPMRLRPASPGLLLRACSEADLPALTELDAVAFGAPRPQLLAAALQVGSGVVAWRAGEPQGFALVRHAGRGLQIGPLVATDETDAIVLVAALLESNPGFMRLDVPATAGRLCAWLDAAGIVTVDRVTPMVRGAWPIAAPDTAVRRYGLASQALG